MGLPILVTSTRHFRRGLRTLSSWSVCSESGVVSSKVEGSTLYQTIIGLEIHAQLDIATKLFSGCPTSQPGVSRINQLPNSLVWPHDVGVPGFLPRLSQEAVHAAVLAAAATKCEIMNKSRFERKHYYYADLPLGYQVTQQRWPLARNGVLECHLPKIKGKQPTASDTFSTRIERIQLEQDTGKTISMSHNGLKKSLVDFNRAGCALIEIVFFPDLRSSTQASTTVETLRTLLRYIGACDGRMEEGSLRCDLNVSVAPISENEDTQSSCELLKKAGNRVEVKNLNSLRQVKQAAEYEAVRQVERIEMGTPTEQETMTFDVKTGKTVVIRTKEGAKDYRFMPEPDLPPLVLNTAAFDGAPLNEFLLKNLPELPVDAISRLQSHYSLSPYLSNVLIGDPPAIQIFDEAVSEAKRQLSIDSKKVPQTVANLLCNEVFALVRKNTGTENDEVSVKNSKITGNQLGEVTALQLEGSISATMAKQLLNAIHSSTIDGISPRQLAMELGLQLISDRDVLRVACQETINENHKEFEKYKLGGKFSQKMTKFFLGKAMSKTKGNAQPELLRDCLQDLLEETARKNT